MNVEVVFHGVKPGELHEKAKEELEARIGYAITSLQWAFDVEAGKPDADQVVGGSKRFGSRIRRALC